jgi:hypothetical protein
MIPTFNPLKDLIVLSHDNARDPDDVPAAVANLTFLQQYGVQDWVAVTGAHGQNGYKYQRQTEPIMAQIFGDRLLNANDEVASGGSPEQRQATANRLGQMWLETISNGGNVFIAEGGQLDTSLMAAQYVVENGGNPSKIYSIQHSGGNMSVYGPGVLSAFTALGAKHVLINDGNRDNLTSDFNIRDGDRPGKSSAQFYNAAINSENGVNWKTALDYYNGFVRHSRTVDFSDAVATMYILGIPKADAPDVFGFADRFFGSASVVLPSVFSINEPMSEEDGAGDLVFQLARTGSTANELTVNLNFSGTATGGLDYVATSNQITFAAGSAIAKIGVDLIADTTVESNETVLLSIAEGTGYVRGAADPITGTILNDDGPAAPLPEFSLWNGATNLKIQDLITGAAITGTGINFRYDNPDALVGISSANFLLTSESGFKATRIEKSAPYFLFGDNTTSGDVFSGNLAAGNYMLTANVFTAAGLADTSTLGFTVI